MARESYDSDNGDLVVPPAQFANLLNGTSGGVDVIVGPQSVSPAATDYPVAWDTRTGTWDRCTKDQALRQFYTAGEGYYVILTNPSQNATSFHPGEGGRHKAVDLFRGQKQNLSGPISFALWPGQEAEVLEGHHLRSNQYLLVRVYNDVEAVRSWGQAVVKVNTDETTPAGGNIADDTDTNPVIPTVDVTADAPDLHMGQLMVIKGTDVSFYIPPTGIEVVKDNRDNHVREAETLERLEFCILLDQNGNKRYVIGPDVVFPEPTETFVSQGDSRKGRALELNGISGIYVKVIEGYTDDTGTYVAGEELFITGNETALYYPRQEHSIIKYGERVIHYATAIPKGEGRYVLNRTTGDVRIEHGASMFLPNPISEVIVRRILPQSDCQLLFPNNREAAQYNQSLEEAGRDQADEIPMAAMSLSEDVDDMASRMRSRGMETLGGDRGMKAMAYATSATSGRNAAEDMIGGGQETTQRKRHHTRPRTLTLDTKYDGVVTVDVHNNYAALFARKDGARRVVVGPQTVLLEYDERPVSLRFSTGDAKGSASTMSSAFLQVLNNRVGDEVTVETSDGFSARLWVRYHLNFVGEEAKRWFDVENYVMFLCERMRSIIRREVKRMTITELKEQAIDRLRDIALGENVDGEGRKGRSFEENSMHVFEMDVSTPVIDNDVEYQLRQMEQQNLTRNLTLEAKRAELAHIRDMEALEQEILDAKQSTTVKRHELAHTAIGHEFELANKRTDEDVMLAMKGLRSKEDQQVILTAVATAEDQRLAARNQVAIDQQVAYAQIEIDKLAGQAAAISGDLADAIRQLGDDKVVETVVAGMAPLSILGGESVSEIVGNMLKGTPVEGAMKALMDRGEYRDANRYASR